MSQIVRRAAKGGLVKNPRLGQHMVGFDDVAEMPHEPFDFPGEVHVEASGKEKTAFNACKTAGNPYDVVVAACLLAAAAAFPSALEVSCDEWTSDDWVDGRAYFEAVLGRGAPILGKG